MKTKSFLIIGAVILLGASSLAKGTIFELPLDCNGVYDFDSPSWTSDFDFGISFIEISNVYIDWAGQITGGQAVYDSNPDDPFPIDVGIYAGLGFNPNLRITTLWGGAATYPAQELFDLQSEIELSGSSTWSDLLDGQGTITIGYTELIMIDGHYVEHGSATLNSASLVVDGIPVPEPATLLLLTIGIACIRGRKQRASQNTLEK